MKQQRNKEDESKEPATSSHGVGQNQDPLLLAVFAANDPRPFEDLCSTQPSIDESIKNSKSGNFIPSSTSFLNSPNDPSVGKVVPILNSNQAEHVVHFNPTFEENSVIEVGVKENLLNAKNHSTVVFKKNSSPKLDGKEARGCILSTENFLHVAKAFVAKGGWKLSKTLKGSRIHFKNIQNFRVLFERLDKTVGNEAGIENFPSYSVTHLLRIKLDHRPLLMNSCFGFNSSNDRPFRFLAGWLQHRSFTNFVKDNWSFDVDMTKGIAKFTSELKNWNKCVYGHIDRRK
ncbi:hypothetical protein Godav_003889 [Gossypium davidsonii]|uniref:Uncharacterized protein n=1 Tax=Gossypium davidsonii TaxID=34287 RepID=A0A7J8SK01_GOSDV|nr:hypothetical protein [Gossypium davidsonii]